MFPQQFNKWHKPFLRETVPSLSQILIWGMCIAGSKLQNAQQVEVIIFSFPEQILFVKILMIV